MGYLVIENFQGGLDTRKARLAAPAGTLTEALDGHITPGGEFEKRKAFVRLVNPNAATITSLPAGTFGLQAVATGLMVFGSADLSAAQWPNDAAGTAIQYQRLQHPAVLAGESYSAGSHAMTAVVWSEVYGGRAFVIAQFADNRRFCYYDGTLIPDFTAGLVLEYLAGNNPVKLATHIAGLINSLENYSAVQAGPYTSTQRAHTGFVATLTIGAHSLQIGNKVWVTGATTAYNVSGVAVSAITATTISYTTATSFEEATTADVGQTVQSAVIDIDGNAGVNYVATVTNDTSAGTVTGPSNTVSPVTPIAGVEAEGSFVITGGSANGVTPTAATGTITRTATNASAGDWIQVGKKKYTFRVTPNVEGDVRIGTDATASLLNLQRAIRHEGTPGTDYICAWAHPWIRTAVIGGSVLTLTAYHGAHGASIALAESTTAARFSVSGASFTGGAGNCVSSVKVISPTGTETELLNGAVAFSINASATAAAVRDNIVAFAASLNGQPVTATVNENRVTILSDDGASPMPNGYHLQVACGGNVLVGECLFYLTQQAASFVLNTFLVDGLDCFPGAQSFPVPPIDTMPEYYESLVAAINGRTGITGINAWTEGSYVKLSRITTRDDDQPLNVYITPAAANTVGIVFGEPPDLVLPLSVTLPALATIGASAGEISVFVFGQNQTGEPRFNFSQNVVASVKGGNGLYTYQWIIDGTGYESGTLAGAMRWGNVQQHSQIRTFNYTLGLGANGGRGVAVNLEMSTANPPGLGVHESRTYVFDVFSAILRLPIRVRVTDSFGNTALSELCIAEFTIV